MIGIEIKNGFLDFSKTNFKYLHCQKEYNDVDDKYLKRCEKNKNGTTKINCKYGKSFFMTYNYESESITFL